MELTFKKKTDGGTPQALETMMLAWPDCLYKEREPLVRFSLLEEAERQGLTPDENPVRRRLMEERYPGFKKGQLKSDDNYLRLWLFMSFAMDSVKRGKIGRGARKDIMKLIDELGISAIKGEHDQSLLYREIYHLAILYINLSLEDKRYGSLIFGFGRMSDDRLARKIGRDAYKAGYGVPDLLKFENYEIWERAVKDAYTEFFPDEKGYYQDLIDGKEE